MKRTKKYVFFVVAILILAFTFVSISGVYSYKGDTKTTYVKGVGDIRWGIDIKGGVEATFSPDSTGKSITKEQVDAAKAVIETRMVQKSITDYEIYADYNQHRIIARFPWQSGEKTFDPETALKELSATAVLTFREGTDAKTAALLKGSDVKSASAGVEQDQTSGTSKDVVNLELTSDGAKKFADATKKVANDGSTLSIWMDDTMISSATVDKTKFGSTGITGGKAVISGNFTSETATTLANQINSGALPFKLVVSSFSSISPTLGASSLYAMTLAGVVGFILVALFMIFMYRLPGFVAVISLCGQMALCFAAASGLVQANLFGPNAPNGTTLTLPGIAGIILSVGMGVDANIITATRIKEEIYAGKAIDHAIKAGDDNSFWAIFDGNVTTILVSIILMLVFGPTNILSAIFGASTTGSIYSFGYTLLIGNIGNFIFGVFTSRVMTRSLSGFKPLRKKWLYGGAIHEAV